MAVKIKPPAMANDDSAWSVIWTNWSVVGVMGVRLKLESPSAPRQPVASLSRVDADPSLPGAVHARRTDRRSRWTRAARAAATAAHRLQQSLSPARPDRLVHRQCRR